MKYISWMLAIIAVGIGAAKLSGYSNDSFINFINAYSIYVLFESSILVFCLVVIAGLFAIESDIDKKKKLYYELPKYNWIYDIKHLCVISVLLIFGHYYIAPISLIISVIGSQVLKELTKCIKNDIDEHDIKG